MQSRSDVPSGLRRAATAWRNGTAAQWVTAFWAVRCVGNREKGQAQALARSIARSVDTVEHLAQAHRAYRHLFRHGCADTICRNKLRDARRALSYSHFAVAYRALFVDEKEPADVLADVLVASEEGSSVRMLAAALSENIGAEPRLKHGEYLLPTHEPDSDLFRQAVATGHYRVVLVDQNAETVIIRYPKS